MIIDIDREPSNRLWANLGIMVTITALILLCSVVVVHILSDWPESGVSEGVEP